jgi:hypothetical protein
MKTIATLPPEIMIKFLRAQFSSGPDFALP